MRRHLFLAPTATAVLLLTACSSPADTVTAQPTIPATTAPAPSSSADTHAGHDMSGEHNHALGNGVTDTADGITLNLTAPTLTAGKEGTITFTIDGVDGAVTDFVTAHEREMHLLLVRDDFSDYAHIHPTMRADGAWTVTFTPPSAGGWRLVADFTLDVDGASQEFILATTFDVNGTVSTTPLPEPAATATTAGGYTVTLSGDISATEHTMLMATITDPAGKPVTVEKYLGADAHLVAFRTTDGLTAHLHPMDDHAMAGMVHFMAEFPDAGRYRMYMEFQVNGVVEMAAFVVDVV